MTDALSRALRSAGLDVVDDGASRAAYASDASLYRLVPQSVVRPRGETDVLAALTVARQAGVPITPRGAGTSVAGNAVGRGVILDFSRHMNRVIDVDPGSRSARVQAGTVHAVLQKQAQRLGLRFGPDPSTHSRCTIGGMIGNNACGARSLAYGRTSDNVLELRMVTGAGERIDTGYTNTGAAYVHGAADTVDGLRRVMNRHLEVARTEFGRFGRQVSGYAAHHLLPERFDLGQALIGSEGTLAVITEATVRLVRQPSVKIVVVIGFDSIIDAGYAAPSVVSYEPSACEGLDSRLIDVLRDRMGASAVPSLPQGEAWLFVELSGDDQTAVRDRARALAAEGLGLEASVIEDEFLQANLWRIREDGAGLAGRSPAGRPAWPGWEDAAVPPGRLGDYLAAFDELVAEHGMTSAPFGHFGEGCMHVRLDVPLDVNHGDQIMRDFLVEAARLVSGYGGSLSGEHGDGRARSELLAHMYSPAAIAMFGDIKRTMDPHGVLNPGVLVDPDPVDADLRPFGVLPVLKVGKNPLAFAYHEDHGDIAQAVHRCTGVGRCRADNSDALGVMCPSYTATREEKDSTRGRARVLQDVIRGELDWRGPEVMDAMDLCLACKGCASDCPTGIDMATYKSEVLYHRYRHRLRPRSHYALGWLPRWAHLVARVPSLAIVLNALLKAPGIGNLARWGAGVDRRRSVPAFARRTFQQQHAAALSNTRTAVAGRREVVLFADTFSDAFAPDVAAATIRVLNSAGYAPRLTTAGLCCGLTLISTGQLDAAKKILGATVLELADHARAGRSIVGMEPSCTAVLKSDALELFAGTDRDQDARDVATATRTLAEILAESASYQPPDLTGTTIVVQPHCHHHAALGWGPDETLLCATGADIKRLSGCCGLAGNFGVEAGHYEVSVAVANQQLLPALDSNPTSIVLADGFSCRTQIADLRRRTSLHLAQLLDLNS